MGCNCARDDTLQMDCFGFAVTVEILSYRGNLPDNENSKG